MTSSPTLPLLREIFAGKRLLFTGATGFLGKVVLARLLCELPDVGQLVCVVRTHAGEADEHSDRARERFVREVLRSPVFGPVRERFADVDIESWVGEKLLPVSGNLGEPGLGLSDDTLARLRAGTVDAVVSCAGLVDFEASLEEAYGTNVLGPRHMIQLAHAVGARFALHVSTCYVPGRCDGSHSEGPVALDWTPSGRDGFSLEREVRELAEVIEDVHRESLRQDAERTQLEEARALLEREGISQTEANLQEALEDARARWLRDRMRAEGLDRAERLGWPNTYSFTKCLGEQIIASEAAWLPYTILRPSVIESAERFPFPGWNQGVNTSAPLVYLAKQGFRGWPVAPDHTLDVVPVDWVADAVLVNLGRGLHAPGAAPPVVQVATGARNPLTMRRLVDLTGLRLREQEEEEGGGGLLSRWAGGPLSPIVVSDTAYRYASIPALGRIAGAFAPALEALGDGGRERVSRTPVGRASRALAGTLRTLERQGALIDRLMEVFRPYVKELNYVFASEGLAELAQQLSSSDRERFIHVPESIDWAHYWMRVHMPGLERWTIPEIERRQERERRALRARNLGDALRRACEREPERLLVWTPHSELSRGQVLEAALEMAAKLEARGIGDGAWISLPVCRDSEFAVRLLGACLSGAVPVLDPDPSTGVGIERSDETGPAPAVVLNGEPLQYETLRDWLARSRALGVGAGDRVLCALDPADPAARATAFVQGWLVPWLRGAAVVCDSEPAGRVSVQTLRRSRASLALAPAHTFGDLYRELREAIEAEEPGAAGSLQRAALRSLRDGLRGTAASALQNGLREWLVPAAAARLGSLTRAIAVGGATPAGLGRAWKDLGVDLIEALSVPEVGGICALDRNARGEFAPLGDLCLAVEPGANTASFDQAGALGVQSEDSACVIETPWLAEEMGGHGRLCVRRLGAKCDRFLLADGTPVDPERAERRYGFLPGLVLEVGCALVAGGRAGGQAAGAPARLGALVVADPAAGDDPTEVQWKIRQAFASRNQGAPGGERDPQIVFTVARLPRTASGDLDRAELLGRIADPDPPRLAETSRRRRRLREVEALPVPPDLALRGRDLLQTGVDLIYRYGFDVKVHGASYVPVERPVLLVSNHVSHLDTPLLRHAMGRAGERLSAMGARDYFFGSLLTRTLYEHFTDVEPFEREGASIEAVKRVIDLLRRERSVLIFPEGSRSATGEMQPFQDGVGVIAVRSGVSVLPAHVSGTRASLPKGKVVPRGRNLTVRFGPLIEPDEISAIAQAAGAERASAVTARLEAAVVALRDEEAREAGRDPARLRAAVMSLRDRFLRAEAPDARRYYFSLGSAAWGKWTVSVSPARVDIEPGRTTDVADCVLVAPPEVFVRMVEDGYLPPPSDFVAGKLKTNRPDLLREFQRVFGL